MQNTIVLLLLLCSSICLAQTDSMFVEKTDGSIHGYPISLIDCIQFCCGPCDVREQEIVQKVLSSFTLYQNYPNPFNPTTTIRYSLPKAGDVEVNIYDIQGRLIRSLENAYQQVGTHSLVWDSRNSSGSVVATGTYFYQVLFKGSALSKKLILIK